MTDRNAPGCGRILAACALVTFGTFGGCIVGGSGAFVTGINPSSSSEAGYASLIWLLATLAGAVIGGLLAARVLRGRHR